MQNTSWIRTLVTLAIVGFTAFGCGDDAPDAPTENTNAINAEDLTLNAAEASSVTVTSVTSDAAGFVVIHADAMGAPGEVIGHSAVSSGTTTDVSVDLDRDAADGETLYAMLHIDDPADGEYTFGEDSSEDTPALDSSGDVVVDPFTITIEDEGETTPSVSVSDQTADPANMVTIDSVTAAADGYIVIHEFDDNGELVVAPELGVTAVTAGTTTDVEVMLNRDAIDGEQLAAMLHTEDNENTTYDGAGTDAPVTVDGDVVSPTFIVTVEGIEPSVTVMDQMVDPADTVVVAEVVAAVDGYIVIHEFDDNGELVVAPELGVAPVTAGTNTDVTVTLTRDAMDGEMLAAMLHSEDNQNETYDGAGTDAPVLDSDGEVITPTFVTSLGQVDSVTVADQTADPANIVEVAEVYAERDGYIVIHDEDENGDLIVSPEVGVAPVTAGMNTNVQVMLNRPVYDGETLYAMLHTEDGGDAGAYDGAGTDAPVTDSAGNVITPSFVVTAGTSEPFVTVMDQLADPADQVMVRQTIYANSGWIVIHEADGSGAPGAVLGQTALAAGVNSMVTVDLSRNAVSGETLFAMLHLDDGDGVYEFPGPDGPVSNSDSEVVAPSFIVATPENSVTVADQTLDTVSTMVTIDAAYALRDGYIVIHEDAGGSFGAAIGVAPVAAGLNGPIDVTLDRPAVDGETLYAMLHTEDGGDANAYDGAATDLPATDSNGDVVTPTFVATVPTGTPSVILQVNAQGTSGYLFTTATPADYFDEVVGGNAGTEDPTLTLRQGWRYSFELGATAGSHPIQFGENGLTVLGDDWKLVQGNGGENTFELDADIDWFDAGGTVAFTVTPSMVGEVIEYQCQSHPGMLGDITITTP